MARKVVPHDGCSATAHVAYAVSEVIAIYPITPSSPMGEICDEKNADKQKNIWGTVPAVSELQSEAGAVGAIHGAASTGALTTTFTASQGLLLMIPNMYKLAGELTPTVFHVSARALACQALSIFGDHSDVMSVRQTGFALLASNSVQEAMDMALISHAATLHSRIPFLHFFDGFRISHEIQKVEELTYDDIKSMIDNDMINRHRNRALSPDHPTIRGTSQNPDVYFTGRETVNRYYAECPAIVQKTMDQFAKLTGRQYKLFEYVGAANAETVVISMSSSCETIQDTVEYLNKKGEKVGLVKVRLYRPFDVKAMVATLPASVKKIAVLDRTKEPGSIGEPLYEDVRTAIGEAVDQKTAPFAHYPVVVGGRYGLGSAEFTPAMAKAVFDNLKLAQPKNHFTVGIHDDVTHTSLEFNPDFSTEAESVYRCLFYGLGSDGTVSANKNSIKIVAKETKNNAEGYFVYDSRKAGTVTTSHLRFGAETMRSPYLINSAQFIACHNFSFLEKYDMLKNIKSGGIFLLASPYDKTTIWEHIPGRVQKQLIDKKVKFYVIDAIKIAEGLGLGGLINIIMQTAFFKISKIMDEAHATASIKDAIQKTYGNKGESVVKMNQAAVDAALESIFEVTYPAAPTKPVTAIIPVPENAPDFVKEVTARILLQDGDTIKVSQMPDDGTWPTGTTQYEKRNIAVSIPVWNPSTCIQCHRCSLLCPHAAIRPKAYDPKYLEKAPSTFKSADAKGKDLGGLKFTIQVAPEDCTGCGLCVENCPAKEKLAISMQHQVPLREQEVANYDYFLNTIPDTDPKYYDLATVKGSQFVRPLFEYSGACAGCGETQYVKLLTQLFGDRLYISNATGCSSIYGGNLPTTPYTKRLDGRGPTWMNSLFEDNAEVAFGMRLTVDKFNEYGRELAAKIVASSSCTDAVTKALIGDVLSAPQTTQQEIETVRGKVAQIKIAMGSCTCPECKEFSLLSDYLVKKSIWAVGGDGWAYDIGYGGVDHVLAAGKNVNIMVLDTEVYSNTGGQSSKSTPMGAVAKFAAGGKPLSKKDMGMIAMSYGYIYVAKIAMGANQNQAVKAFMEAEAYDGPSLIICYSHCINHGINMVKGMTEQKNAVESGHWPLYRYNPALSLQNKNPLQLDSKDPTISVEKYALGENRYRQLKKSNPEVSAKLLAEADRIAKERYAQLKKMAGL